MSEMAKFFGCLLLFCSLAWAQSPAAEITGTVTDPTSAAVADATVTITNAGTGIQRNLKTNSAGVYDAPALPPGSYSVKVAATGFRAEDRSNVEIQVGQVSRLDFTLQVGNVEETIEVRAQAATLETETTTVGTVIENKRIVELPLNGRNYLQLASLVPGGTTYSPPNSGAQQRSGGDRANFALNVAGQRIAYNHYSLDGIENTDPNFNTYLFQPSIDALQEFKVENGTFGAEYGHGVGQVNVITRSGGNAYHGTLFEFLRNANLDAKNFFDKSVPPFKRNQFGGTLGGPVQIPKVVNGKNNLFFFFDYEGLRQRKAQTAVSTLPFMTDRTGDFSGSAATIYDPATRILSPDGAKVQSVSPFPGNIIPANRIAPQSAFMLQNFYPQPNNIINPRVPTNNYLSNEGASANSDMENIRVDWSQNANSLWAFRYSHASEPQYAPGVAPLQGGLNTSISHQGMLGHTWVLGTNKVNDFRFGISRLEVINGTLHQNNAQYDYVGKLGIPALPNNPLFFGIPVVNISNFTTVGDPPNGPYVTWDTVFQWTDNFSWTKGKHNVKFGGEFMRTRFNNTGNDVPRGRFSFTGQFTSLPGVAPVAQNSVADFLLGDMTTSEGQLGAVVAMLRGYSLAGYIQDQWKVTPHLTVNYGLRYEFQPGFREKYDHMIVLDYRWNNSITPTFVRPGTGDPYEGNPPFPLPSSIPYVRDGRFGNGSFRSNHTDFGPRVGIAYNPTPKTVIRAGAGIYYVHEIGSPIFDTTRLQPFSLRISSTANALTPNETWDKPFPILTTSTLVPAYEWGSPTSYVPQWSFAVERQLTSTMSLEVGYLGSAGVHLQRFTYYNSVSPAAPGVSLQQRRPFPQLGFVQLAMAGVHSSYDALNARLQQRFSHGLTILSAFTWSKAIDNGSGIRVPAGDSFTPQDVSNLRGERGLSAYDFRMRSTTSILYELPLGKGKAVLNGASGLVNALVGGWQLGGIFTAQSGFPFTVLCQSNATYMNTEGPCYADATGTSPGLANPGPSLWFNKAAFTNRVGFVPGVGPYRPGNNGRNNVIGPGILELDMSLAKTFHPTERTNVEFRSEFFNVPNHPIFGQPGATVGSPSFGVISSTRLDPRQIQFGLKLSF